MKILVTGSSGLVGTALVKALESDCHTVQPLRVRADSIWRGIPEAGELGGAGVGPDAVVNLAGASIAGGRWTKKRKELLRMSRIATTRALLKALAKMNARPRLLVSASAIGIYGHRGDEVLTEESKPGTDFLASLAREWEAEALKAEALGMRVVLARFGIILAKQGGALAKMLLPFKLGAGGRLGSGKQWMSWITLDDVVAIIRFVLENTGARGAINIVAPGTVQNTEFTKALAKALRRPALFPAPPFALRLALGEMADALLLSSQRVAPQKLQQLGYSFQFPELAPALQAVLG